MQELRFVLIIVGVLAIAALLIHGLWTSKKEHKSKFSDKPLTRRSKSASKTRFATPNEMDVEEETFDPLISLKDEVDADDVETMFEPINETQREDEISLENASGEHQNTATENWQVIVLNVHMIGQEPFAGTQLFSCLESYGLQLGDMDIYHYYAQPEQQKQVLFSVANMVHPGTLAFQNDRTFSTPGISFFMTLPSAHGSAEQNFKLMLRTVQQIADELGGHVLDEAHNLMTPDRLDAYRKQVQAISA